MANRIAMIDRRRPAMFKDQTSEAVVHSRPHQRIRKAIETDLLHQLLMCSL